MRTKLHSQRESPQVGVAGGHVYSIVSMTTMYKIEWRQINNPMDCEKGAYGNRIKRKGEKIGGMEYEA